jgi:hypothetical protein
MRGFILGLAVTTAVTMSPLAAFADGNGAVTGAAGGAVTGAVLGGPVGAVVGAGAGAVVGGAASDADKQPNTVVVQPCEQRTQQTVDTATGDSTTVRSTNCP